MLNNSKVMVVFYPLLFQQIYGKYTLFTAADIIGLNFILPGSHIKVYFSLVARDFTLIGFMGSYICLYFPTLLITCIYLGYRKHFNTIIWDNSLRAMQAVGNGLVISTIIYILI